MIRDALENRDYESEAFMMTKLALVIRNELFAHKPLQFNGTIPDSCQSESVPTILKSLVSMILNGPNAKDQDFSDSQVCLTIAQLISFNVKVKSSVEAIKRHRRLEPPIPL